MQNNPEGPPQAGVRPKLLTVLCILSYIMGGVASLSYFMIFSMYSEIMPELAEASEQMPAFKVFLSASRNYFLTGFILYFISIIGVSLMWRFRKAGFHFYTGAQVMILVMPLFYIQNAPIPFYDGVLTLLFILLYSRFYRLFS
jgi:hypothetical protein